MARLIHCEACKDRLSASAQRYGELYESLEGTALRDLFCDGSCTTGAGNPTPIRKGEKCFAAVLLNNREHRNYEMQKPESWASDYLQIKL